MSNHEDNDAQFRGVVEWTLASWGICLALMILLGGADTWSAPSLKLAMQAPGHQYTWGGILLVISMGKLFSRALKHKLATGLFSGLIALWCYGLFCVQVVSALESNTATTIGLAAWLLIGTVYMALAAKHGVHWLQER